MGDLTPEQQKMALEYMQELKGEKP